MSQQVQDAPTAKFRKDYQSPSHTITHIDLEFDLFDKETVVTAVSKVKQLKESNKLCLEGEQLKLMEVAVNGVQWQEYQESEGQLVLDNLPTEFELTINDQELNIRASASKDKPLLAAIEVLGDGEILNQ